MPGRRATDRAGLRPAAAARRAQRDLAQAASPTDAAASRAYFKKIDVFHPLGVRAPVLRRMARDLGRDVRGVWEVAEAEAFADRMVRSRFHEPKMLGILLLARYERRLGASTLRAVKRWILAGHLANWASIDAAALELVARVLRQHEALVPRVAGWRRSPNPWLRRAGAVALVPLARRGLVVDTAFATGASLAADPEDLVQKAAGWLLREAGRSHRRRLEALLMREGPRMSRTAVRYAIEHFPERARRRLLVATRP